MFKKLLILFLLFLPATLFAQNNNGNQSVTISVQATVMGSTEVITIQTVDFEGVDRNASIISIDPVQSARAGKMIVRGAPNAEFRMDFLRERELNNTTGTGMIFFTYEVSGNMIDEQNTSEMLDQDIRDLTFNADGEFYIWVGGRVDLRDVEPGSYEGEFSIEIDYI